MITDEDARMLVANIRGIAKINEEEAARREKGQRAWLEGRADAYRLAARWIEESNHKEESDA